MSQYPLSVVSHHGRRYQVTDSRVETGTGWCLSCCYRVHFFAILDRYQVELLNKNGPNKDVHCRGGLMLRTAVQALHQCYYILHKYENRSLM